MDEEDKGENRTIFSISNAEIAKTAQKQCQVHSWSKLNDIELACTLCPTVIICGVDDPRLLEK